MCLLPNLIVTQGWCLSPYMWKTPRWSQAPCLWDQHSTNLRIKSLNSYSFPPLLCFQSLRIPLETMRHLKRLNSLTLVAEPPLSLSPELQTWESLNYHRLPVFSQKRKPSGFRNWERKGSLRVESRARTFGWPWSYTAEHRDISSLVLTH